MGKNYEVKIEDNSEKVLSALEEQVEAGLEAVGLQAESLAKLHLEKKPRRVDTGLLRNSITHAVSGKPAAEKSYHATYGSGRTKKGKRKGAGTKTAGSVRMGFYVGTAPANANQQEHSVYIGTNVEYAPYVHDGTKKMTANRFLTDSIQENRQSLKQILLNFLQN